MRSKLAALAVVAALALAGCGIVEDRKDAALRLLAGRALQPIVKAQSGSPLLQGEYTSAGIVAPRPQRVSEPAADLVKRGSATAAEPRTDLPVVSPHIEHAMLTPAPDSRRKNRQLRVAYGFAMPATARGIEAVSLETARCIVRERHERLIETNAIEAHSTVTGTS
jgi:hypothetical protein